VLAVVQRDHGPVSVRVHRWVDAAEVPGGVAGTPAQAGRIGRLMAWLHRIGAEMIESARPPVPWKPVPDEEWRERAAAAAVLGADWAHPLRDIIPGLSALAGDLERWLAEPTPAVVSHGDLNQTNWRRAPGGRLMLFDWDGAGIVSTDLEVGSAALEWAGVSRGAPAMDTLAALIAGYRANGGTLRLRGPALFAGWLRGTVWWLGHCVDRIIAGRETDDALLAGAHFHVRECLEKVPRVYRSLDAWTAQAGL
jgi:aminoglycoside phosphotransferase (APT) family kinase protein